MALPSETPIHPSHSEESRQFAQNRSQGAGFRGSAGPQVHQDLSQALSGDGAGNALIEAWLEADRDKPKKQRHTARRIYQRLKEEYGFKGSEESVRRAVRLIKQRQKEKEHQAYIPLEFALGEAAQCDWGEAKILLGFELVKVYLFFMRLCASRAIFVRAYLCQSQEAFFEGHRLAFEFFGGVPKRVIYDNLKTAVKKVLKGTRREEQEAFVALRYPITPLPPTSAT